MSVPISLNPKQRAEPGEPWERRPAPAADVGPSGHVPRSQGRAHAAGKFQQPGALSRRQNFREWSKSHTSACSLFLLSASQKDRTVPCRAAP